MVEHDFRDYKKQKLSQSDKGRGIKITSTASPGQTIHTALSTPAANEWDEVWLQAINQTGSAVTLTILWGGTSTDDQIKVTVAANSELVEVISGLVLNGGAVIAAFASSANAIIVHGFVNRYELTR